MSKNILKISMCLLCMSTGLAQQKKDRVLLKIDDKPVYQSEFVKLFGKNKKIAASNDKNNIEEDLNLFINYKLKLLEAKELKLDTVTSYKKEVARYRNQLTLPYLSDSKYTDMLVAEAYERSLKEVKASHILVKIDANETDTINAYEKISKIREEILGGADFATVAARSSEDPSAVNNKGDLGYFSVFRMVYSFENKAYQTKVGEVSDIFRSQFGYHIMKVYDVRDSKGEVEVAHIMVRDLETEAGEKLIHEVYDEILNGGNFEELAKKYSDDRRSSVNGGKLPKFPLGGMPPPFDEVSFSLSLDSIYSKPFKTGYGWHIVKFIQRHKIKSFEESKKDLSKKIKRGNRTKNLPNPVVERLEKEYTIEINEASKKDFFTNPVQTKDSLNTWILKIQDSVYTQNDFYDYIKNRRDRSPEQLFKPYVSEEILNYYKANLENSNEEFNNLFTEYKNGLLLFDLMKLKIWDAAKNDSLALQKHFNSNYDNYKTKPTVNALIVRTKEKEAATSLEAYIKSTSELDSIKQTLSIKENIILKEGDFETKNPVFPKNTDFTIGQTKLYKEKEYFVIVKILSEQKSVPQKFKDIKGIVISDYQKVLEENWLKEIKSKHKIKVKKRTLKKAKKALNNYDG